jgi:hypothetical protein
MVKASTPMLKAKAARQWNRHDLADALVLMMTSDVANAIPQVKAK